MKVVKGVKQRVKNKGNRTTPMAPLLLNLNIVHTLFQCFYC